MQAIITKYHGATNHRPSKMSARCERGAARFSYDHGLNADENHRAACDKLCAQFDAEDTQRHGVPQKQWSAPKAGGALPSGEHVFCFIPERVYRRAGK